MIPRVTLQTIAKRSTLDDTPDPSTSTLSEGWQKLVLLVLYFFPEHEELAVRFTKDNVIQRRSITETNQVDSTVPAIRSTSDAAMIPEIFEYWSSGWEENFDAVRGKVFVAPVTRLLLLELPVSTLLVKTSVKENRLRRLRSLRGFVDRVIARWQQANDVPKIPLVVLTLGSETSQNVFFKSE